jgi:hypothetical protein
LYKNRAFSRWDRAGICPPYAPTARGILVARLRIVNIYASSGDRKTLDHYRNRLLRRAEAIQRRLDEVTRAAREELVSIKNEIRALDSVKENLEEDSERQPILWTVNL